MPDLIGQTLGHYRITEQIGEGGMATVYKAYQPGLERYVAVKVLPPIYAKQSGFSERFQREAKAIAQLHHPNILPVHDFGQEGEYSFIVMRYIEGARTLKEVMDKPLDLKQAVDLVNQIAAALEHAHQRGIIHRDVKPSNVLMDGKWALLTDFGLAKITASSVRLTGTGVGVGTPAYMSPEQGEGRPVDHRTDIYALGTILFEMLTGQLPYDAETPVAIVFKRSSAPLPLPRAINPAIPETVERVILKALAREPSNRFTSAGAMAAVLEQAASQDLVEKDQTAPLLVDELTTPRPPARSTPSQPAIGPTPIAPPAEIPTPASALARLASFWKWGIGGMGIITMMVILCVLGLVIAWIRFDQFSATLVSTSSEVDPLVATALPMATPTHSPTSTSLAITSTDTPEATSTSPPLSSTTPSPPLPGGGRIVFMSDRDGNLEIYVMNADGSNQIRLTNNRTGDDAPAWSPDGRRIAFVSERDGNQEIYVMNADGSDQTNLTNDPADDQYPTWSPDGTRIAFTTYRDDNREIYVMNADGSGPTNLTNSTAVDWDPAWSPDGARIAFASNLDIHVMNADGSGQTNLTNHPDNDRRPAWSPDGQYIAFATDRDGDTEIYVMNHDGIGQKNLTNNSAADWNPAWSPDGKHIAFSSDRNGEYNSEIYSMKTDGSEQINLTNAPTNDFFPCWGP